MVLIDSADGWHWPTVMDGCVVEEEGCVYLMVGSCYANGGTWSTNLHKHNHMFGDQRLAATSYKQSFDQFSNIYEIRQPATELTPNAGNCNRKKTRPWSSPMQSYVYFQFCRLELETLFSKIL